MSWIRRETEKGTVQYICPHCHDYHEFREDFGGRTFSENYIFCRRCGARNGTGNAPTLTPPNEPLTLEQLRGTPHGKIKDKTLQHICDRANELAYAYPTAHIDREKWEPCDACSNAKHIVGLALAIMDDGSDHRVDTKMNCEYSFCPNCGRPLTDEAWAELERRVCGEV